MCADYTRINIKVVFFNAIFHSLTASGGSLRGDLGCQCSEEAAHGLMLLVPIALVFDSRDETAADLAVLAALIDAL